MTKAISCRDLISFLDDYLADQLSPQIRESFERHLTVCRHCRDYLKTYRETIALARGAYEGDANDASTRIPEDLVRAVLAARQQSQ